MYKTIGATLRLENGMEFKGFSFGYSKSVSGEVVFSTVMEGYPEQLTDAAYCGKILCLTYPLIGNYGVPSDELLANGLSKNLESDRIHAKGLVVFDYCEDYSNWEAVESLDSWMKREQIPGIYGIDTRELAKILRDNGPMKAVIIPDSVEAEPFVDVAGECLAEIVSCSEPIVYAPTADAIGKRVVVVDNGVMHSYIRALLAKGVEVVRVPWQYDFSGTEYDGLFISSGPGDPQTYSVEIEHIKKALEAKKPVFGLGLGMLLVALAAGAQTKRLARPHRSANQPVRRVDSNRAYITAQNAEFTVENLPADWSTVYTNLNDGSIDGIRHKSLPFMGTQFNPEACIGLNDNFTMKDEFISKL